MKLPSLELVRMNEDNEFWLRGVKHNENKVNLFMHISSLNIPRKTVNFEFYLDSDTSLRVADEMVEQLELADYDVPFISEFIDYLIMCLVPDWVPLDEEFSSANYASTVENGSSTFDNELSMENELMLVNRGVIEKNLSQEKRSDDIHNKLRSNYIPVDNDYKSPKEDFEEEQSIFGLALNYWTRLSAKNMTPAFHQHLCFRWRLVRKQKLTLIVH